MASRNPDFAALSEAAYEAADNLIEHQAHCRECSPAIGCDAYDSLAGEYHDKKAKALKAIRGKK